MLVLTVQRSMCGLITAGVRHCILVWVEGLALSSAWTQACLSSFGSSAWLVAFAVGKRDSIAWEAHGAHLCERA